MYVQNMKFIASPVPEIKGGTQKIWAVPEYAHTAFQENFQWAFIQMDPVNVPAIVHRAVKIDNRHSLQTHYHGPPNHSVLTTMKMQTCSTMT